MVELKESEINQLKAVVGLADKEVAEAPIEPEVKAQDNVIPEETEISETPKKENAVSLHDIDVKETDTELFVKIDEHVGISNDLMGSKLEIKGLSDTVLLLAKAEQLKSEAIERTEKHLDKLDTVLKDVELKLAAPESLKMAAMGETMGASMELFDLHTELDSLKDELSKLK
ncbi:MAG: hypothetical protein KAI53_01130 [Candidatus Aenigmarchaeota archaeon]|nr:hypothetical protein [Candidatus Aenigmarchaeota archaeon]